jgi:hypothetical protein
MSEIIHDRPWVRCFVPSEWEPTEVTPLGALYGAAMMGEDIGYITVRYNPDDPWLFTIQANGYGPIPHSYTMKLIGEIVNEWAAHIPHKPEDSPQ